MTFVAMTIAGSDSGGGAGIQADLKTFQELGVFGTAAITSITAQNTLGVRGVAPIETKMVAAQIKAVLDDFDVKAIKTGMLFSAEIIQTIADTLRQYPTTQLVIDPVMIAKGGAALLLDEAILSLKQQLIPLATVVTPNIPEAEVLAQMTIESEQDIHVAAEKILQLGTQAVIMKGGHRENTLYAEDIFFDATGQTFTVRSKRIHTQDTHGTGCTFSAAIAAFLSQGKSLKEATISAKGYIQAAISHGLRLGAGRGPTNHWAYRQNRETIEKEVTIID